MNKANNIFKIYSVEFCFQANVKQYTTDECTGMNESQKRHQGWWGDGEKSDIRCDSDEGAEGKLRTEPKLTARNAPVPGGVCVYLPWAVLAAPTSKLREGKTSG